MSASLMLYMREYNLRSVRVMSNTILQVEVLWLYFVVPPVHIHVVPMHVDLLDISVFCL